MVDIAALGLRIDADPVDVATVKLNQFGKAAGAAEQAAGSLGRGAAQAGAQTDTLGKRVRQASADVVALAQRTGSVDGAMRRMAESLRNGERSAGLARHQIQNLTFQANDLATGLLSGQSAFQVFAQQGGQIAQILQQSNGGVMGGLRGVGSLLRGLVTPARLAVGGIAAVAAAGVGAWAKWQGEQDRLAASMAGLGRASGATLDGLNRIAEAQAKISGLSNSQGRTALGAFIGAGLRADVAGDLIASTKGFARITGQDLSEAAADLAKMARDPTAGLEEMQRRFGGVTAGAMEMARAMQASGDKIGAQRIFMQAANKTIKESEDRTWSLKRAWDGLTNSIDNAIGAAGKAISGPTINETIDALEKKRERAEAMARNAGKLPGLGRMAGNAWRSGDERELLDAQNKRIDAQVRAAARADEMRLAEQSNAASPILKGLVPERAQMTALEEAVKLLSSLDNAAGKAALGPLADGMSDALDRLKGQVDSLKDSQGRLMTQAMRAEEQYAVEVKAINARTDAQRAAIASERELISLRGQALTQDERKARAAQASQLVMEQGAKDARDRLREAQDRAALSPLSGYERTTAEISQRWMRQNEHNAGNAGALALNERAKAAELLAARQEAILKPVQDTNRGIEEQSRLLDIQDRMFGASTGAMAKAVEFEKLLATAKRERIPLDERLIAIYDAQAEAMGRNAQRAEDMQKAQAKIVEGMDAIRDSSRGAFSTLANGIINHKSGREIFGSIARDIGGRLIESGGATFTKALLGENGKPGGGLFGDTLSSIFGLGGKRGDTPGNPVYVAFGGMGSGDFVGAATGLAQRIGGTGANDNTAAGGGLAAIERATGGAARGALSANGRLNPAAAMDYLQSKGLTSYQAAAFLGNVQQESQFKLGAINEGEGAFGLYQTRLGRRTGLEQLAASRGVAPTDAQTQLDFFLNELKTTERGPGSAFLASTDLSSANSALKRFIRYGDDSLGTRQRYAEQIYGAYGTGQGATTAPQLGAAANSLDQFADAAAKIPSVTDSATKGLGTFGDSLGSLGGMLGGAIGGKGGAAIGSLVGGLFGRVTKLFGFEDGGIMTAHGPLPLRRYAGGGIADRPQLAMFGEGSSPEAYVPVPSGKIPVALMGPKRGPAPRAGTVVTIGGPTINIAGDASEKTVALISEAVARSNQQAQRDLQRNIGSTATKNAALFG